MHFLEWLCSAHNLNQREHGEWLSFIKQILWFNNEHFFSLLQEVFIMWAFCFFPSPSFSLTLLRKAENAANNSYRIWFLCNHQYAEEMIHGPRSCVPYTYWTLSLHFLFCGPVSLQSSSANGPCRLSFVLSVPVMKKIDHIAWPALSDPVPLASAPREPAARAVVRIWK